MMDYLKKPYQGRVNRMTYFLGSFVLYFGMLIIFPLSGIILMKVFPFVEGKTLIPFIYSLCWGLLFIHFNLGLIVRRIHDLGYGDIFIAVIFIPIVNILFTLWLLFVKGDAGLNKYGQPFLSGFRIADVFRNRGSSI